MKLLEPGKASSEYRKLASIRENFLATARECSEYTVPWLLSDALEDKNTKVGGEELVQPNQSMGSRGVNNMAAKLLLALLPANTLFFELELDEIDMERAKAAMREILAAANKSPDQAETEIKQNLARIEGEVLKEIETTALRPKIGMVVLNLVVTGNALLTSVNDKWRAYRLDSYVVERDPSGSLQRLIIEEVVDPRTLEGVAAEIAAEEIQAEGSKLTATEHAEHNVCVYTLVERTGPNSFVSNQEIGRKRVPGQNRNHDADTLPFLPLRMYSEDGEDYGRGHVEMYLGDLRSLDGLSEAVNDGAAAACRVLGMVRPGSATRLQDVQDAENGDLIEGHAEDITFAQLQKYADFTFALNQIARIEQRLGSAFLLNSTAPRHAERVTAEEVRFVAQELEDQLAGVFSQLSAELQLPLVRILISRLEKSGRIKKVSDVVRPAVVTGLAAIGRGHELARMERTMAMLVQTFGDSVLAYFNPEVVIKRVFTLAGVETEEIIKSHEQVMAERQQQIQLQLAQTPAAAKVVDAVAERGRNGAPQQAPQPQT